MSININILYSGSRARSFAEEMLSSGTLELIRSEKGNIKYEYYLPFEGSDGVLLIEEWEDEASLDAHHKSPMMNTIISLRTKYGLTMTATRYTKTE